LDDFSDYAGADSEKLTVLISPYQPSIGVNNELENDLEAFYAPAIPFYIRGEREIMKGNISGTGAVLSGEFMMMTNNLTTTPIIRRVVMPEITYFGIPRSRRIIVITTGNLSIVEQTINNQLGFILRQDSEGNFSASVRMLEEDDSGQIKSQPDMDYPVFVNASEVLTEQNTWYKIEAVISKNETNARLYEQNGALLKSMGPEENVTNSDQLGILMSYNPNAILAFRNLRVETLDPPPPQVIVTQKKPNDLEWLGSNIYLQALAVVALATVAVASYVKKMREKKKDESRPTV
jgi:hypothetical protein